MIDIQQLPPTLLETLGRVLIAILFLVGLVLASILVPSEETTIRNCIIAVLTP